MRVYFDVSCLNRPFDDQRQSRIRSESEAITSIFERIDRRQFTHLFSEMVLIEVDANPDIEIRRRIRATLPAIKDIIVLTDAIFQRAEECERMGFKAADAVHVAAAEASQADVLLSCDDRMRKTARRCQSRLRVKVMNPVEYLEEFAR